MQWLLSIQDLIVISCSLNCVSFQPRLSKCQDQFKSHPYRLFLIVWCWPRMKKGIEWNWTLAALWHSSRACSVIIRAQTQSFSLLCFPPRTRLLTSSWSSAAREWLGIRGWTQAPLLKGFSSSFHSPPSQRGKMTDCQSGLHPGLPDPSDHWLCFKCSLT